MVLGLFLVGTSGIAVEGDVKRVADPCIIEHDGCYYIFSTGRGIPIRRSEDLFHWTYIGRVFDALPDWARETVPKAGSIWAPDISLFDGKYYLYYSVSTFGHNRSCIGLATNTTLDPADPDYKWVDCGKVIESRPKIDDWNAIDPNAAVGEDGKRWLFFGSFWGGIKMVELNAQTGKPDPGSVKLRSIARRPEAKAVEAPFVVRRNGYWYLFVSFDQCCKGPDSTYKTMVGRAKQITGPYRDRAGKPLMDAGGTLVLAGHDRWRGPGHNAVISHDGTDWLVHHTYDATESKGSRNLQIRTLIWADDGWPLAGEPWNGNATRRVSVNPADLVGSWAHSVNYAEENTIRLDPGGRIGNGDEGNTWSLDGADLILRWPHEDAPGGVWIDRCRLSPDGRTYIGRNQQGMVIRGVRND